MDSRYFILAFNSNDVIRCDDYSSKEHVLYQKGEKTVYLKGSFSKEQLIELLSHME